jgi:hypothetical protein
VTLQLVHYFGCCPSNVVVKNGLNNIVPAGNYDILFPKGMVKDNYADDYLRVAIEKEKAKKTGIPKLIIRKSKSTGSNIAQQLVLLLII